MRLTHGSGKPGHHAVAVRIRARPCLKACGIEPSNTVNVIRHHVSLTRCHDEDLVEKPAVWRVSAGSNKARAL